MSSGEVLIKADNVSKKFCRRLKRALWYGLNDLTSELLGRSNSHGDLREGEFWAVYDASFELRRGQCLGLIGRNGAGKSTLLKMLNGLIKPDKGRIEMRGRVGALIELGTGFNPVLTGRENVYVNAAVLGIAKAQVHKKLNSIIEFAEIGDFIDMPVQHYSSGMRVRLGFAVAAQMEPDVLLIDEVLAVGDLGFKIKCLNAVSDLLKNSAVIFVSHTMQWISSICTKLIVLDDGNVEYFDNDVPAGINYYHTKFTAPIPNILGSGKARVSDIQISNGYRRARGEESLLLNWGDDLSIDMSIHFDSSAIQPVIKLFVLDAKLTPIAECFSEFSGLRITPKTFNRINLQLTNLRFSMGTYSITIVLIDLSNMEVLSRIDGAAHFKVRGTYSSWAPVLLTGKWTEERVR
ncbi:MAG: ABC transporter ATP-binding protein [Thermodesulfobacteriota bacterium]|nr:ABC transporter ATP-binding protein [Thermodesulfobacteriota bacterium]